MRIDVHHHFNNGPVDPTAVNLLRRIMVSQAEVVSKLGAVAAQLSKALAEIQAAIANQANASPELVAAAEALEPIAQALDALNEDAPPVEPPVV
jgi:hypothetical protein